MKHTALWCTVLLAVSGQAHANSFEDVWGAGSRMKGMGGAGTAASDDFSAVYYNPANLGMCTKNQMVLEYTHVGYGLQVKNPSRAFASEKLRNRDGLVLGACGLLPWRIRYGVLFGYGFQHPQYFSQTSPVEQGTVALYGQRLEQLSILAGLGARVWKGLYAGLGVSVLVNSTLQLDNRVPVYSSNKTVYNAYAWDLSPHIAVYGGISYDIHPRFKAGLSYRGSLFHTLNAYARTGVDVTGVPIQLDLLLQSVAWFSPQQVALGVYGKPLQRLGIALDFTWYDWSVYHGPYIKASPLEGADARLASSLNYPQGNIPVFSDVWVPRVGAEYTWDMGLSARLGYSYRRSPLSTPKSLTNLLDSSAHMLSAGGGCTRNMRIGSYALALTFTAHATVGFLKTLHVTQPDLQYQWGGHVWETGLALQAGY